jgi:iron complex transport system permease protein
MHKKNRTLTNKTKFLYLAALLWVVLTFYFGVAFGSSGFLPCFDLIKQSGYLFEIRITRVLFSFLLGAGLSISGAALQGLLRNPLVSPYTIGVSSASSLGAVIAIRLGLENLFNGYLGLFPLAVTSGILTMFALFWLARNKLGWSSVSILLAGITISFFCSSAIMFVQYTSTYRESFRMVRWLMGNIEFITQKEILVFLPFFIPSVLLLLSTGNNLNYLSLGDDTAVSSGVNIQKTTVFVFLGASLLTATSVSMAGPVAFIGLISPHVLRLLKINNYRQLLPLSALFGGGFLVLSDLVARTIIAPQQIPVGVITSLLGGPFFLFILLRKTN